MSGLIIVESPTKAKTISKIIGKEYTVMASYGHIMDLPDSKKGTSLSKTKSKKKEVKDPNIDLRLGINTKTYEPIYVLSSKSKKIADDIKRESKTAKEVLIATDPDREGESIASHIAEVIGKHDNIKRVSFHEITPKEIKEQIHKGGKINVDLVQAQKARRVLDRLVGYKVSPLLWKKFFIGLSAGRVQSVALKAVVEREREIKAFIPTVWFELIASYKSILFYFLQKDKDKATLKTKEDVEKIKKEIEGKKFEIQSIDESMSSRSAPPPFTTSTLQQIASGKLYFAPKRTMSLAQSLFEAGVITYHRTDSLNLSKGFIDDAKTYIEKVYGSNYAETRFFKTKSKNAQEAHEAIRPTSLNIHAADHINPDAAKLYRLIFSRAIASQMKDAKVHKVVASALVIGTKHIFHADFQSISFDGYTKLYDSDIGETVENPFKKGDTFIPDSLDGKETSTKPPARYNEASLIKFLEEKGIGRPSTYASIISTIVERKYVEIQEKRLIPTDTGIMVMDYLNSKFVDIMDYGFTADLEQKLDDISNGERKFYDVMIGFDEPFEKILSENLKDTSKANTGEIKEGINCPICGKAMIEKLGRFGKFLSCIDYPECKGIIKLTKTGETDHEAEEKLKAKAVSEEFLSKYKSAPKSEDGKDYLLKKGRFGEFWAHPDYPKVKDAKPLEFNDKYLKETYGEAPKATDGKAMILRSGRFGYFWAHPDYPKVKELQKAKKIK